MEKSIKGEVALVTGGSKGVGAASALALAEADADVAIGYVSSDERALTVVNKINR